ATLDNDYKGKKQVGEIEQLGKIEDGRIRSTQVSGLSSIKELKIGGAAQRTDNSKGKEQDGEIIGVVYPLHCNHFLSMNVRIYPSFLLKRGAITHRFGVFS
ncbi:hypothetical protein A2U01_0051274, partial [Trifolium medium]|nr:hypothetical protein [Trifolium medium]